MSTLIKVVYNPITQELRLEHKSHLLGDFTTIIKNIDKIYITNGTDDAELKIFWGERINMEYILCPLAKNKN